MSVGFPNLYVNCPGEDHVQGARRSLCRQDRMSDGAQPHRLERASRHQAGQAQEGLGSENWHQRQRDEGALQQKSF